MVQSETAQWNTCQKNNYSLIFPSFSFPQFTLTHLDGPYSLHPRDLGFAIARRFQRQAALGKTKLCSTTNHHKVLGAAPMRGSLSSHKVMEGLPTSQQDVPSHHLAGALSTKPVNHCNISQVSVVRDRCRRKLTCGRNITKMQEKVCSENKTRVPNVFNRFNGCVNCFVLKMWAA